jgi:hypothetical protein
LQPPAACSNTRSRLSLHRLDGKAFRTSSTRHLRIFRWCRPPTSRRQTFPIGRRLNGISPAPGSLRLSRLLG